MRYTKCMKYLLILFDGMLVILAVAAVALGAYILHKEYGIQDTSRATHNRFYEVATYLLFASSTIAVLIGLCGCLAARFESKCLVIFHCVFLGAVLLLLGCGTAVAFIYRFSLLHAIKDRMHSDLITFYEMDDDKDRFVTNFWDFIQRKFKCCGLEGGINSTKSWAIYKLESKWYKQFALQRPYVPTTCCTSGDTDINVCTGVMPINGIPRFGPPFLPDMSVNSYLHTQGCYTAFIASLDKYAIILAVVTLAILLLTAMAMLTSICFCKEITRERRDYAKATLDRKELYNPVLN